MSALVRSRYPSWANKDVPLADTRVESVPATADPMDSGENQVILRRLQEWWQQAREVQSFVRLEMDIDENFYHGDQFTTEDRDALEAVGQAALVFNKTKPVIDWLIGTERRTRVDFNVLPRHKGKEMDAKVKKDVLKYISDTSKAPYARSDAAREAFISGLGWLEVGVRGDDEDEPVFIAQESWRNIWYDALGTKKDTSDWRYLFRSKWTDLDVATAMFPTRSVELKAASQSINSDLTTGDDDEFYIGQRFSKRDASGSQIGLPSYTEVINGQVNNRRERVRLVECWYRMPVRGQKVSKGKHHGRVVNLRNQKMMYEVNADIESGVASVYDAVIMQVRCAVFCENTLLQNMVSPYHHNKFPFVPIWAYRKGKFHEPYGVVRNCRDPQEDLNKRYSKALFLMSSTRIIADKNAVQDWEALREEVGRPDAQLLLDTPKARFEIHVEKELAEQQVRLVEHDGMHIQEISGVTSENLGRDTNAVSGKAVLAKQTQGSIVSAELFDNIRQAQQHLGELTLSVCEQFIDQPKAIRISGERGEITWHDINGADGKNDITATQMDYIVTEQDFRDTMKQAMHDSLMDTISKMDPNIAIKLLDSVVDLSDFPGKADLVARIRKINGQLPPVSQQSDEEKKQAQAMEQAATAEEAVRQKAIELEFAEKQSKIDKANAEAERIRAEIPTLGVDGQVRSEMEAKIAEVQRQASVDQAALQAEIAKNQAEQAARNREIELRRQTDIDTANIKAASDQAMEQTRAEATKAVAQITAAASVEAAAHAAKSQDTLTSLQQQVEHHKSERDRTDKAHADARKQDEAKRKEEGAKADKDKADKQAAEDKKAKAESDKQKEADKQKAEKEKADAAKKPEPAQQPINIAINVDAGQAGRRSGTITKDPKTGAISFVTDGEKKK